MKIRRIDERCSRCMRCVEDCASGVWRMVDKIPVVVAPESCNRCGHCLSVCPENAIENDYLKTDQVRPVDKNRIDPAGYREIALSRRSIRRYKNKPVDSAVIKDIIDLACFSPTASNSQHVAYTVITDPDRLRNISETVFSLARRFYGWSKTRSGRLIIKGLKQSAPIDQALQKYIEPMEYYIELTESGRDLILHNAPALILLHGPSVSFFASDNCHIAATNIANYAHALGLGTCFIGFVTLASRFHRRLCGLVELPKGRTLYASLVIGHPAFPHPNTASRKAPSVKWIDKK